MPNRTLLALGALALLPAVAGAWGGVPPPAETLLVDTGYGAIELWPYTTDDFETPYDPVNLFFPDTDPRAVRQALLGLTGTRPPQNDLPPPFGGCTWADGMGSEQAAWAEPEGWVGGEIQLVCIHPGAPLGDPFRFHVRLFRQGTDTLGGAHFDFLLPGTGEHDVLSWDFARLFVLGDIARSNRLAAPPDEKTMTGPGYFRTVRRPVYDGLVQMGAGDLLAGLGLSDQVVDENGNPRIPTSGTFVVLPLQPASPSAPEWIHTEYRVDYGVNAPKPFCSGGPNDYVHLSGPVDFELFVYVDAAGRYIRYYKIDGELMVKPIGYPPGPEAPAVVKERHSAYVSDHHGQLSELGSRRLLSEPPQTLAWKLFAGGYDAFGASTQCGP